MKTASKNRSSLRPSDERTTAMNQRKAIPAKGMSASAVETAFRCWDS